jgi:hypothetical protein
MSTVLVVAPIVVANWPAITAAIAAAMGAAGFAMTQHHLEEVDIGQRSTSKERAEIEVENSEILAGGAGVEQKIVVERDGITATFTRDARGALRVCMEGKGHSKAQLKQIGEDLIGRVTQQYAYNRLMTEMKERNLTVVHEEVDEDRTVRIRVRNW